MNQEDSYFNHISNVSLSDVKAKSKVSPDRNSSLPANIFQSARPSIQPRKRPRNDQHFTSFLNSNNLVGIGRSHISDVLAEMNNFPHTHNNSIEESEGLYNNESYASLGMNSPIKSNLMLTKRTALKLHMHDDEIEEVISGGPTLNFPITASSGIGAASRLGMTTKYGMIKNRLPSISQLSEYSNKTNGFGIRKVI